jgi:hypothetical protein
MVAAGGTRCNQDDRHAMEAAMIPTTATTTLVNDHRQALIRQARLHQLAAEGKNAQRTGDPGGRRRRFPVVLGARRLVVGS